MTTYSVEPDADNTPVLMVIESDRHAYELATLSIHGDTISYGTDVDDHGVVFRAAAAVLAPDEAVVDLVASFMFADYDPPRGREEARVLLEALRDHVEEATP